MRLLVNEKRMLLIAFCAALYWASSILLNASWIASVASIGSLGSLSSMIMPVAVCAIGGFYLVRTVFFKRNFQLFLAASVIVANAASFCISALGLTNYPLAYVAELLLPGYYHGCSIVFWGLNFASLSKEESEKTVFMTLLFTFMLYLAGSSIDIGLNGFFFAEVMKMIAVIPFLLGFYELTIVKRESKPENQKLLPSFIVSRCFFGIAIGSVLALAVPVSTSSLNGASLVTCALLLFAAGYFLKSESKFSSLLRVAPIMVVGPLILPHIMTEGLGESLRRASGATIWLAWIILSSVQLSDLKERLGWDEARLVLFEKLLVVVPWLLTLFIVHLLRTELPARVFDLIFTFTPSAMAYLALIVSCYLLTELIANKEKQRILERAIKHSKDELVSIHRTIYSEYHLTNREKEVFELLSRGYTRPNICKQLVISEGTARSHIDHIYKKLDIHSREELHAMIRTRQEDSEKSG
jgi:DNA-binding CsgD family transcriptional regulator